VRSGPATAEEESSLGRSRCQRPQTSIGDDAPCYVGWTSKKVQSESDGEIFWKITTGHNAMPSWKHLSEQDRWALVRYIRSLGGK